MQKKYIFAGRLPKDIEEEEVRSYFEEWGTLEKFDFKYQRGFAFVTFEDPQVTDEVLAHADQHTLQGEWIDCKRASDKVKGGKGKGNNNKGGKGGDNRGNKGGNKGGADKYNTSKGHTSKGGANTGKGKGNNNNKGDTGKGANTGKGKGNNNKGDTGKGGNNKGKGKGKGFNRPSPY